MPGDRHLDWLNIPPQQRPPNHYQLLGLPNFESSAERIEAAYRKRFAIVNKYKVGPLSEDATEGFRQLAAAYDCLRDAQAKREYDRELGKIDLEGRRPSQPDGGPLKDTTKRDGERTLRAAARRSEDSPAGSPDPMWFVDPDETVYTDLGDGVAADWNAGADEGEAIVAAEVVEEPPPRLEAKRGSAIAYGSPFSPGYIPPETAAGETMAGWFDLTTKRRIWACEVGQAAFKALCVTVNRPTGKVQAVAAFRHDYPRLLTQPDADPQALIAEALQAFRQRHQLGRDELALVLPWLHTWHRNVRLPPVQRTKLREVIAFEARQAIPFAPEEVVWDSHWLSGQPQAEGFVLDAEVLICAAKRELLARSLKPFDDAGLRVRLVAGSPLALYNLAAFDLLAASEFAPIDPAAASPWVALLDIGADSSSLVVTNGVRVWTRSLPIGGNHFTRALTKELKLPFARAEELKRNSSRAEDPKAVFQAMRPVFQDLQTEVQRSLNFFQALHRDAKLQRLVALGGGAHLPGLVPYLARHLHVACERLEGFARLHDAATGRPLQDVAGGFAVCYGLALQGLRPRDKRANLLPPERRSRKIAWDRLLGAVAPLAGAVSKMDRSVCRMLGEENTILHGFVRTLAGAGVLAIAVALFFWIRSLGASSPGGGVATSDGHGSPAVASRTTNNAGTSGGLPGEVDPLGLLPGGTVPGDGTTGAASDTANEGDSNTSQAASGMAPTSGPSPGTVIPGTGQGGQVRLAGERAPWVANAHSGGVYAVVFSANGQYVIAAGGDHRVSSWRMPTGERASHIYSHGEVVRALAISPDGNLLASGGDDRQVILYRFGTGQFVARLYEPDPRAASPEGPTNFVTCLQFSPNGKTLFIGTASGELIRWDIENPQQKAIVPDAHVGWIYSLAALGDYEEVAVAGEKGEFRIWRRFLRTYLDEPYSGIHTAAVRNLLWIPSSRTLISSGDDNRLQRTRLADDLAFASSQRMSTLASNVSVRSLAASPDGTLLAAGCSDGRVRLWDLMTGELLDAADGPAWFIQCLAFSRDGKQLAAGCLDGSLWLWSIELLQLSSVPGASSPPSEFAPAGTAGAGSAAGAPGDAAPAPGGAAPAGGAPKTTWKEVRSTEGRFTVQLPENAKRQELPPGTPPTQQNAIVALVGDAGSAQFTVVSLDATLLGGLTPDQWLATLEQGLQATHGLKVDKKTSIELGGVKRVEYEGTLNGVPIRSRVYATTARFYQVAVVGPEPAGADAVRFFESFKITGGAGGPP
jgi:type IV pilus assembly protein PilM